MEGIRDMEAGNKVIDDNAPLPESAVMALSVRARHTLERMPIPKTYGGIKSITYEKVMSMQNAGAKTAREIMEFRQKCLDGTILSDPPVPTAAAASPLGPPRIDDPLPAIVIERLSNRARNVLGGNGIKLTPRGICALDFDEVKAFPKAGKKVAGELMDLKQRCIDGSVWDEAVTAGIDPGRFGSLSEFVMAVAQTTCKKIDERGAKIMSDYMGLLNVEGKKTLEEVSKEFGLTRERVRQISAKFESCMFSASGKAKLAEFVQCASSIFEQRNGVVKKGEIAAGLNAAYPAWTGTTEFSALRLLGFCGVKIETNDSGRLAWMTGGRIVQRYATFLNLLDDEKIPLESLTSEAVLNNADALGLAGITEDEYMFLVYRAFDKDCQARGENKSRWALFLKLRCGLPVGDAAKRRYVVTRVLRSAGARGLTYSELVDACRAIDPAVDIGTEANLKSDADKNQQYNLDGTGVGLLIYDYGDKTHERRYSLDVFFEDTELVGMLMDAGDQLRRHMEANSVGAANITKLVDELNDCLPERYAADGLPSACVYHLMWKHNAGGLKYYDHPNVAHPDIVDANGGKVPEMAISWVVYEYFLCAGHETATSAQLADFCDVILGLDRVIAKATVLPNVMGEKVIVDGEERYKLKRPVDGIEEPNLLLDGGKIDAELTFSSPRLPLGMKMDESGRALNFSTYVRLFLMELAKSGYAFTEDEERELADPGWCYQNLGSGKAVFVRAEPDSTRPSISYWRVTYRVGKTAYWVSRSWRDECKHLFDKWASDISVRAGFAFKPYEMA